MSQEQQQPNDDTIDPVRTRVSTLTAHNPKTKKKQVPPTDYGSFVVNVMARSTAGGTTPIDQRVLRQCLGLASSFLITDTTINPLTGADTWYIGFSRLVDIVVALHARDELDLETVNIASRACSECWMVAGSWRGLLDCKNKVKEIATKLRMILDPNDRTYRGCIVIPLEFSASFIHLLSQGLPFMHLDEIAMEQVDRDLHIPFNTHSLRHSSRTKVSAKYNISIVPIDL
jgi:hypothetical protein